MGRAEDRMRFFRRSVLSALIALLLLSGCAEKGPILLAVGYQAPEEKTATASNLTVGVSPLKDGRGKGASVLGKRTIPSGQVNDLVIQGMVADLATVGLKRALASRGFVVLDAPGWDLTADGMKTVGAALLFGGEIRTLWLESTASPFKTHLQASVQLRVVAGDVPEKKIVRTIEVSSKLEQDVLYSREKLEEMLSEALTSAIDQIFSDEELRKRIQ